ncbi:TetR/AcrR family transcriptional regulator [Leeia sp.]|uniref:TetR/AcrR family transcriptional regulator n=1 Tax=Leeia sp. TaxID=2884678 RepID=UPI0035B1419D
MSIPSQKTSPDPQAKIPQRSRGIQRVDALLHAASEVFHEHGYTAATMSEVARRAGAPIGSLYQFFPNKALLADAVINRYADRLLQGMQAIQAEATLTPRQLARQLFALMLLMQQERAIALALVDAADPHSRRQQLRDALLLQLTALLARLHPAQPAERHRLRAHFVLQQLKQIPTLHHEAQQHPGLLEEAERALHAYLKRE